MRIPILLLLIFFHVAHAHSHDNNALSIYVDNSYPPYMFEHENGQAAGLYPKLLREIFAGTDMNVDIHAVPWKRALLYGESGDGAVGGAYKNQKRMEIYDYSAPIYQEKLVIFVHRDRPFSFNEIKDLAGKTIGVNRGWSYGQQFDDARDHKLFKVNVRADPSDNFKMLALGRIDCLILDQLSGESYMHLLDIDDKIMTLPVPFSMNDSYLIISKERKMKAFLNKFDASLKQLRENGMYDQIVQAFFQNSISSK